MRYLFGFMCVMALGVMGCSETQAGCWSDDDCGDENECTEDVCDIASGTCSNLSVADGMVCNFDGTSGVCVSGTCGEDLCEGVVCEGDLLCVNNDTSRWVYYCDYADGGVCKERAEGCLDYNQCTYDRCDPETGDCFYPVVPDGENCCLRYEERCGGICIGGDCSRRRDVGDDPTRHLKQNT
jgi:hypothetical protein